MLCCVVLCFVVLCCVVLCCVESSCVGLGYVVLGCDCYVVPFSGQMINVHLLLSTHSHGPCCWEESDVPACGPPASFSVHLASSAVTPAGSVHKSRGDNVVRMWVQLKR